MKRRECRKRKGNSWFQRTCSGHLYLHRPWPPFPFPQFLWVINTLCPPIVIGRASQTSSFRHHPQWTAPHPSQLRTQLPAVQATAGIHLLGWHWLSAISGESGRETGSLGQQQLDGLEWPRSSRSKVAIGSWMAW